MTTITIKRPDYYIAQLKSWGWILLLASSLFLLATFILNVANDRLWLALLVVTLLKLGDAITQFYIRTATIYPEQNQLELNLSSIMSGDKSFTYNLANVNSDISRNNSFNAILFGPLCLKIQTDKRETYRITSRYGFTSDNLETIHQAIQRAKQISVQI